MECDFLIVGAGVTGLSFANFVNDKNWIICEASDEIGGYCKSIHQDGFVWDYSGHFFHFANNEIKNMFLSKMKNVKINRIKKITSINYKNNKIDFPFQKNIHQLPKNEFIDCLYDLYKRDKKESKTFLEMLYSNFGKSITEKFLRPYNEKLYACNLNDLDSNAMGRFFPYADFDEVISNFKNFNTKSYNSDFLYPENGAFEFIKALTLDLDNSNVYLNHKLQKIDLKNKVCYFSNNKSIKYNHLISTIPFPKLLKICNVNYQNSTYTSNKVLVYNLGFDKGTEINDHWIYFPDRDTVFYRVGFYNNIIKSDKMSLYVEIGLNNNENYDLKKIKKLILNDLKKHNIIKDHNLISEHSVVMNPAYVHIKEESNLDFKEKSEFLKNYNIYSIGRYGGWKYCSIEDNVVESMNLARYLNHDF